ncbi:ATP-binding protein [Thalassospira lucentensis]|uniref:sensor histidine kinase n=1 Tax=Thalassospira lucentensis TaxID=168935 RepID=UPI003AA7CDE6
MFSTKSLQFALTKRLTVMISLFWIAGSLLADFTMYHEMQEVFDSSLVKSAYRYAPLIDDYLIHNGSDSQTVVVQSPDQGENKTGDRGEGEDEIGEDYLMYQVRDLSGRLLLRSANASDKPYSAPLLEGFHTDDDFRIYSAVVHDGTRVIQVAESLNHRHEALVASVSAQFLPIILLIPAVIIGIIFAVRQGLQPVRRVRDDIEARSEGNLSPIEQHDAPDEIHTMVRAVNRLMEKLDAALRAERTFTAHSAHELRTPIAAALAQTQRLLLELTDNPQGLKRAQQTEESLKRLSRLSEKLLQLARAEAGVGSSPTGENQNLGMTLSMVIDDLERVSDGAGRIQCVPDQRDALTANIDVDAFAICMRNLIENALKHGKDDSPVVIEIKGSNVITVSNDGDVVDPQDMTELTARFKRSHTKARGAGLGLSIVDTIMRNTGGKLTLHSPRPGKPDGFMAELWLHQS